MSILIQESCAGGSPISVCSPALPIQLIDDASSVAEFDTTRLNYATVRPGTGPLLTFELAAANSLTVSQAPPANFGRIHAEGIIVPTQQTRDLTGSVRAVGRVSLTADRFPSWEFRRYPRILADAGDPDRLSMGDRAAGQLVELVSPSIYCAGRGQSATPYLNLMSCPGPDPDPATGLPRPYSYGDNLYDVIRYGSTGSARIRKDDTDIRSISVNYAGDIELGLRVLTPKQPANWINQRLNIYLDTTGDSRYEYIVISEYYDGGWRTRLTPGGATTCYVENSFDGQTYFFTFRPWCLGDPAQVRVGVVSIDVNLDYQYFDYAPETLDGYSVQLYERAVARPRVP